MTNNQENIKLWCEGLESGKFKQWKGRLFDRDKNSYCCLGVAARLAKLSIHESEDKIISDSGENLGYEPIYSWLGMSSRNSIVIEETSYRDYCYPMLNDSFGLTFEEIAHIARVKFLGENDGVIRQSIIDKLNQRG